MLGGTGAAVETKETFGFTSSGVKLFTVSSPEMSSFFRHADGNAGERESEQEPEANPFITGHFVKKNLQTSCAKGTINSFLSLH